VKTAVAVSGGRPTTVDEVFFAPALKTSPLVLRRLLKCPDELSRPQ